MTDAAGSDLVEDARTSEQGGASALGLFGVAMGFLFPVAFSSNVYAAFWTPKAALVLMVVGVGLPLLVGLAIRGDFSARAILAFLVVASVSAGFTDRPALAVFGLYNNGLGVIFFAGIGAAWAIGRHLSDRARSWLLVSVLVGVGANVVISVSQTVIDLSSYQLGRPLGRADGLLGNPVHLGALTAAGAVAAAYVWVVRSHRWALAVIVLSAVALQLSGTRFALAAAIGGLIVVSWRRNVRRSLVAAGCLIAGLAAGSAIATASDVPTGTTRVADNAAGGVTPRTEIWLAGAKAYIEKPLLGWGPGRYREATGSRRTLKLALAEGPEAQFLDAHNLAIEVAVTTGALGLIAFAAFGVPVALGARGALGAFGLVCLSLAAVQPLNVSTVPLGILCLGAASTVRPAPPSRPYAVCALLFGALGLASAGLLLYGDFARLNAELDFDLAEARRVDSMSPPWPESAELIGRIYLFRALIPNPDDPALARVALAWRTNAAERDPSDSRSWSEVGELSLKIPDTRAAKAAFHRALQANPQSSRAYLGLGESAAADDDWRAALKAYEQALRREPVASNRTFIERRIVLAKRKVASETSTG